MLDARSPATNDVTLCIAENRATCEPALRMLVASLAEHVPGVKIVLFCPNATIVFQTWLSSFEQCILNPTSLVGMWTKYDIKPIALLTLLDMGSPEVVWLDSDILVTGNFVPLFASLPTETMVVAEEALMDGHDDPDGMRARMWGMTVGRNLPFAINSGVIRVTGFHLALLQAWRELLEGDAYRSAQELPWYERPCHMAGDQEVLTSLLSSAQFSDIKLRFLRRGQDIIQFFGTSGYTVRERWLHLWHGAPFFVHSQGFRPWWPDPVPTSGWSARFRYLYHALSPYTTLARRYRGDLEDDRWLQPPTRLARLLTTRHPSLTGLPLAVVADAVRLIRHLFAMISPRSARR